MNTSQLENVAESLIAHELMRMGFLVAKPLADELGADLLAFADFDDGVRFCRIQCKGRTVKRNTQITVPSKYVKPAFVVFLYVSLEAGSGQLFCFFASDIRQWEINAKKAYVLNLSRAAVEGRLQFYRFSDEKMKLLNTLVKTASRTGIFHDAVYGEVRAVIPFKCCTET